MEICCIVLRKRIMLLVLLFCFPNSISTYTTVKMIPTESIMMHIGYICNPHIVTKTHILMIGFTSQLLQITQHNMDWNQPQTMSISILPDDLLTEQNNILGPLTLGCSIHTSYSFFLTLLEKKLNKGFIILREKCESELQRRKGGRVLISRMNGEKLEREEDCSV